MWRKYQFSKILIFQFDKNFLVYTFFISLKRKNFISYKVFFHKIIFEVMLNTRHDKS